MTPKKLLVEIAAHLKRSGEKQYPFGQRVLNDKAFVYKLKNYGRKPTVETIDKIMAACNASRPKKRGKRRGGRGKS